MPVIESEYGDVFNGRVSPKTNKTGKLRLTKSGSDRNKGKRVSMGYTEVLVKISGFGKGSDHVKSHLDYISRNGKLEIETDNGEVISGLKNIHDYFDSWDRSFETQKRGKNHRDSMHVVLSMPEGTEPGAVRESARDFASKVFGKNHEYAFALHTDTPQPHVHVAVKYIGFNGERPKHQMEHLQEWRELFAENLREHGIGAEATPRIIRGITKKPENSIIKRLGERSWVRARRYAEAAAALVDESKGIASARNQYEIANEKAQIAIRKQWLSLAARLERDDTFTKNGKPIINKRPDYENTRIRTAAKQLQRKAALHQSNLAHLGKTAVANAVTRLRNLPGVDVVSNRKTTKLLLREAAQDRLGWRGVADTAMRRAGTGVAGTGRRTELERLDRRAPVEKHAEEAKQIRQFVAEMPEIETQHQAIKQELRDRFTVEKSTAVEKQQSPDNKKAVQSPEIKPPDRSEDIEL